MERYKKIIGYLVFMAVAAMMSYYYARQRWMLNGLYAPGSLEALLSGTADQVFQSRVLVPWLVAWIGKARLATIEPWLSVKHTLDWFRVVEAVSAFLLVVSFRRYVSLFVGGGPQA